MKNTTKLDMTAILDSYTQEVIKEEKRRAKIRQQQEWFAKWNDATYGTWNISDRD